MNLSDVPYGAAALRTSPNWEGHDPVYTKGLPNTMTYDGNLVIISNKSSLLFEGDFKQGAKDAHATWRYTFVNNVYAADRSVVDLSKASLFGGCSPRSCHGAATPRKNHTFAEWQAMGHDVNGATVVCDDVSSLFKAKDWRTSLDVTLAPDAPPLSRGWQQIDTKKMGLLTGGGASTPPPTPTPTPATPPPTPLPRPPTPAPTVPFGSVLRMGDELDLGKAHVLTSNNTVWELVLQGDSNLCVKRADSAQTPLHWCSMTNGTKERRAIFQHDGNFCVGTGGGGGGGEGGGGGGGGGGGAVGSWCTKTAGMIVKPGAAAMLNNGSFCIMSGWGGDGDGGEAAWCDKR